MSSRLMRMYLPNSFAPASSDSPVRKGPRKGFVRVGWRDIEDFVALSLKGLSRHVESASASRSRVDHFIRSHNANLEALLFLVSCCCNGYCSSQSNERVRVLSQRHLSPHQCDCPQKPRQGDRQSCLDKRYSPSILQHPDNSPVHRRRLPCPSRVPDTAIKPRYTDTVLQTHW
ncbi:hypothetical protein KC341_g18 [Hortaea werneckii]|nr:hypothetical protein KC341_g18 [Hortaea werneckii]